MIYDQALDYNTMCKNKRERLNKLWQNHTMEYCNFKNAREEVSTWLQHDSQDIIKQEKQCEEEWVEQTIFYVKKSGKYKHVHIWLSYFERGIKAQRITVTS